MTDPFFELIECETAQELMNQLDPKDNRWSADHAEFNPLKHWLFRGQADANWVLCPPAWRENSRLREAVDWYEGKGYFFRFNENEKLRRSFLGKMIYTELILLWNFVEGCNQQGLYVTQYRETRQLMRDFFDYFSESQGNGSADNDPNRVNDYSNFIQTGEIDTKLAFWRWEVAAIARHHGLPSRLLDWTYNSRKAAYFAIENDAPEASNIAIFAFHDSNLLLKPMYNLVLPTDIKLVTAARYHSSFISAQEAVFTVDESADKIFFETGAFPSLEQTLERYLKGNRGYKFTLPVSEKNKLRRLLRVENIHRASLMPTYDNIASHSMSQIHDK